VRITADIDQCLNSSLEMPDEEANERLECELDSDSEIAAYVRYRCDTVTSLVLQIRDALRPQCQLFVIPTTGRPTKSCWIEGSDLASLARVCDGLEVPFYEPTAERVLKDAEEVREIAGQNARIRGILRPGDPDLIDPHELIVATRGLAKTNVEGVSYYNYGLLKPNHHQSIANAAKSV
jgi:hypothetical protein